LGGARIDLQNNNLSLFEASTFRSLLEKMKGAETSSADIGGRLLMYQSNGLFQLFGKCIGTFNIIFLKYRSD